MTIKTYERTGDRTCENCLYYKWCGILYCGEYPKECNQHVYSLEWRDNNVLQT